MALIGELSDLSLAELIEVFCNQRKSGRLQVVYPMGEAYFYLKAGSVVHARFGELRGIDAIYFALTQPNASFNFNAAFEPPEQSINQPWASVVLEGLRRMDQGVAPPNPFPNGNKPKEPAHQKASSVVPVTEPKPLPKPEVVQSKPSASPVSHDAPAPATEPKPLPKPEVIQPKPEPSPAPHDVPAFGVLLSHADAHASGGRRRWGTWAVVGSVVLVVGAIGLPWGWYSRNKAAAPTTVSQPVVEAPVTNNVPQTAPETIPETTENSSSMETTPDEPTAATDPAAAKRLADARAKERAKQLERNAANNALQTSPLTNPAGQKNQTGARKVTVQVTYDENGRVTQASGGDATALRIARQKRFPPGKPGSATVTIPIN
jgi:Domain of unknown function (DUF4388)